VTFEDLNIKRQFLNALEDLGFEDPTPIQVKAIPSIANGQDVIGIAQTGTGKTAAYLLPILGNLKFAQSLEPRCLILVPTKELVIQVKSQVEQLSTYTDLRCVALFGGVGPNTQIAEIVAGSDIIVATPGRFTELYSKGHIYTRKIKHLVLDEADRMLDMGFMPQIRRIQEVIPQKHQKLLFSATFPQKVESLCDEFLLWPVRVEASPPATPVSTVTQHKYRLPNFMSKLNLLLYLIQNEKQDIKRLIVFVRTRQLAENITRFLSRKLEDEVRSVHSNKGQNSRHNAMNAFREGDVRILVTTDVSARGIDIPDVSHVINFSVPRQYDDYIHRIGRTGRVFKSGIAITFVDKAEEHHLEQIEDLIQQKIPLIKVPEEVEQPPTPKAEILVMAKEIDDQRKRQDPTFKGAFHDKKDRAVKAKEKKARALKKRKR
jgi:ATP-dependent RNA helicase RhlE